MKKHSLKCEYYMHEYARNDVERKYPYCVYEPELKSEWRYEAANDGNAGCKVNKDYEMRVAVDAALKNVAGYDQYSMIVIYSDFLCIFSRLMRFLTAQSLMKSKSAPAASISAPRPLQWVKTSSE